MDPDTLKAMAEESMLSFANGWHADLGLDLHGVALGDALQYDIQRVLGNVWKRHLDEQAAAAAAQEGQGQP